jgi:hypothetical protein
MTNNPKISSEQWEEKLRFYLSTYSKEEHLSILKKKQQDTLKDPTLISKLKYYNVIVYHQLHWEIRWQFFEIVKDYIEERIDFISFKTKFFERCESIDNLSDQLISDCVLLSPNKNCFDFGNLIDQIANFFEICSANPKPYRADYEIDAVEFDSSIEKIYLEMQDLLSND